MSEPRDAYDGNMGPLKKKLQRREEWADVFHALSGLQSSSRKKKIKVLEKMNAVLRTRITKLTARTDSERYKQQPKLQKEKRTTTLQMKTVARLSGTIQSLSTNVDSLSSEIEALQKGRNDDEFIVTGLRHKMPLWLPRFVNWLSTRLSFRRMLLVFVSHCQYIFPCCLLISIQNSENFVVVFWSPLVTM